nr:RidA family protein [Polymorphobacter sp.]
MSEQTPAARLAALGIVLPTAAAPAANYVPAVAIDGLLHISGQIPFDSNGALIKGRLGDTMDIAQGERLLSVAEGEKLLSVAEGAEAARRCAIGLIAQMQAALGDLGRVRRIVKLGVFVASTPDFTDQPEVGNGASNLMVEIFGEAGRHARSAVGVAALPRGVAVEIDAIIAIHD